jgi:hypothetical protein
MTLPPVEDDGTYWMRRALEAEAEVARLKEDIETLKWCATCDHFGSFGSAMYCSIECTEHIHAYEHQRPYGSPCQYEPSKWTNGDLAGRYEEDK